MSDGGFSSLQEAFNAALAEEGAATPPAGDGAQPAPEPTGPASTEQAPEGLEEQATATTPDEELQASLDDLFLSESEEAPPPTAEGLPELGSDEFWDLTTEVNGETVKLRDLRDDGLRQADYTRKTQELAETRKMLGRAAEAWEQINADPLAFYTALGKQLGLLEGPPNPEVPMPTLFNEEQVKAMVEERAKQQVEQDPRIRQAHLATAQAAVERQFRSIESKYGVKLNDEHRVAIMNQAASRGHADLELVFAAQAGAPRKGAPAQHVKAAANLPTAARPKADVAKEQKARVPETLQDALEMAQASLAAS